MYGGDETSTGERDLTGLSELLGNEAPPAGSLGDEPTIEVSTPPVESTAQHFTPESSEPEAEQDLSIGADSGPAGDLETEIDFAAEPETEQPFEASPPLEPAIDRKLFPLARADRKVVERDDTAFVPFHLTIEGRFDPYEKEKFLSILKEEEAGISEMDLEPQFEEGRILIPRVSEYVCVRLIQELRDARVLFRLFPSETDEREMVFPEGNASVRLEASNDELGIGGISIFSEGELPEGGKGHTALGALVCSSVVKTTSLESQSSPEVLEAIDALKREMRSKAKRLGATSVLRFRIELVALPAPTHFRILATGTAVR